MMEIRGGRRRVVTGYSVRTQRHARWVRRFSADSSLHDRLFSLVLEAGEPAELATSLAERFGVPPPEVRTHARRRINTGTCQASRAVLVRHHGRGLVEEAERRRGRRFPERAVIRIGVPTLAGVLAHEFGHHLVNERDGPRTPGHGKVWVGRYDEAARVLARLL